MKSYHNIERSAFRHREYVGGIIIASPLIVSCAGIVSGPGADAGCGWRLYDADFNLLQPREQH